MKNSQIAKEIIKQVKSISKINKGNVNRTYVQTSHNTIYVNNPKELSDMIIFEGSYQYVYFDVESDNHSIEIKWKHFGIDVFTLNIRKDD